MSWINCHYQSIKVVLQWFLKITAHPLTEINAVKYLLLLIYAIHERDFIFHSLIFRKFLECEKHQVQLWGMETGGWWDDPSQRHSRHCDVDRLSYSLRKQSNIHDKGKVEWCVLSIAHQRIGEGSAFSHVCLFVILSGGRGWSTYNRYRASAHPYL